MEVQLSEPFKHSNGSDFLVNGPTPEKVFYTWEKTFTDTVRIDTRSALVPASAHPDLSDLPRIGWNFPAQPPGSPAGSPAIGLALPAGHQAARRLFAGVTELRRLSFAAALY